MKFLVFQLQAPLSSWGDTAVGEYRGSYEHPGESALIGLLGAALGIRREDEAAHTILFRDPVSDDTDNDGVGNETAIGHNLLGFQADRRTSLNGGPKHFAG